VPVPDDADSPKFRVSPGVIRADLRHPWVRWCMRQKNRPLSGRSSSSAEEGTTLCARTLDCQVSGMVRIRADCLLTIRGTRQACTHHGQV
jgi:hypothetical protein